MNVRHVSIRPTEGAEKAGRYALTPELLAATGARYSRNNEGLDAILANIDFGNRDKVLGDIEKWLMEYYIPCKEADDEGDTYPVDGGELANEAMEAIWNIGELREAQLDKGVDSIFKMVDYGHQSIADMAPVAMFMDGVSILLAYILWSIAPTAGGQESSTRYIKLNLEGLVSAELLGIPEDQRAAWMEDQKFSFEAYNKAVDIWTELAIAQPELMRIPQSLIDDTSEKAQKQVERMRRNYAFDRARVFLPVSAATNVMMVQSARDWVRISSYLQTHPTPECQQLGALIKEELELVTPRLTRHAKFSEATAKVMADEFEDLQAVSKLIRGKESNYWPLAANTNHEVEPRVELDLMLAGPEGGAYARALRHRENRYSLVGNAVARTSVRFAISAIAMAEARDLNRHRTGTKFMPLLPCGFYTALDQVPDHAVDTLEKLKELEAFGGRLVDKSRTLLEQGDHSYIYHTLLGHQYLFEHTTTADKFVYECELRTGLGAHYRYAKHMHDVLDVFYAKLPEVKGLVFEGSAEPE